MEKTAKAIMTDLPISTKQSIEIADFIRNKTVNQAKELIYRAINKKIAVPFRRFNRDMGHKKGVGAGRYPIKALKLFLKLLNLAEANAQFKNIDATNLIIGSIIANKGVTQAKYGRQIRTKAKRTNLKITVKEQEVNKK